MSEIPGPADEVMARAPAQPAPSTMPIAASSSSAWTMAKVALPSAPRRKRFMYSIRLSGSDDEGVMGYQATMVTPANMQPSAAAELPSMMILPAVLFMRWMKYGSLLTRLAAAYSYPA